MLVVAAALLAGLLSSPGDDRAVQGGSPDQAASSAADTLTSAELSGPTALPAAGVISPTQAEWRALLPRLIEAADADPGDRNGQRKLALAYYNLGRLAEARDIYDKLLQAEEDPVLRNRLGNTLRDLGDTAGAEEAYRRAMAEDPTLAPPYLNLAELLWRDGRDAEALTALNEGMKTVPKENQAALKAGREFLLDQE